jgi:hypothetical protein
MYAFRITSVPGAEKREVLRCGAPVMQIRYSQDHQYIIVEDGVGTVGITNYAQEKLSDVTTVELPHVGAREQKSVKVASDLYSPVSGEILGVNEARSRRGKRSLRAALPMCSVPVAARWCRRST